MQARENLFVLSLASIFQWKVIGQTVRFTIHLHWERVHAIAAD